MFGSDIGFVVVACAVFTADVVVVCPVAGIVVCG